MDNQDDLTLIWKALADPTRRRLLDLLKERPRTTGDLCDAFNVSRFAIMKHLSILEKAELIVVRRHGRERWNHLNAVPLQRIYERWLRPYEAEWASALLQLKRHVETTKGVTMADKTATTATLTDIQIEQNITIQAPPHNVFDALTQQISTWWGPPYFHNSQAKALVLEPQVGGRLYEDLGNNQGLLLATVVLIKRPEQLRLAGAMGLSGPVQGVIQFQLESQEQGTLLQLSHRMIGDVSEETRTAYAGGWQELLGTRLRNFVEQGRVAGVNPEPTPDTSK